MAATEGVHTMGAQSELGQGPRGPGGFVAWTTTGKLNVSSFFFLWEVQMLEAFKRHRLGSLMFFFYFLLVHFFSQHSF